MGHDSGCPSIDRKSTGPRWRSKFSAIMVDHDAGGIRPALSATGFKGNLW
jgi:hypothetical protein